MGFVYEERASDSPYVETITRGRTLGEGSTIRPAESHWHMVVVRQQGSIHLVLVGPWTTAGVVTYTADVELLWIKFRLGAFLPHWPVRAVLDRETILPGATRQSFWLQGSAWPYPDYEHADTFVNRLVQAEVLVHDPVVDAMLHGHLPALAPRTVRQRFARATGVTHSHIRQVARAQRAAALLQHGTSIADAVYALGYYDQPHLTRALKRWIGQTPTELIRREPAA
jgi:hypothetical protein